MPTFYAVELKRWRRYHVLSSLLTDFRRPINKAVPITNLSRTACESRRPCGTATGCYSGAASTRHHPSILLRSSSHEPVSRCGSQLPLFLAFCCPRWQLDGSFGRFPASRWRWSNSEAAATPRQFPSMGRKRCDELSKHLTACRSDCAALMMIAAMCSATIWMRISVNQDEN